MAVRGKVLIVEDDRAICSFMRRVLEANGYESIIVGTVPESYVNVPDVDSMLNMAP